MPAGSPWRMCPSRCPRPPRPRTSASSSTSCWRQSTVGPAAGRPRSPASPPSPGRARPARAVTAGGTRRASAATATATARAGPAPLFRPGSGSEALVELDLKRCGYRGAGHSQENRTKGWNAERAGRHRPGCRSRGEWKRCPKPGTRTNEIGGLVFVTAFKKTSAILSVLKWAD